MLLSAMSDGKTRRTFPPDLQVVSAERGVLREGERPSRLQGLRPDACWRA